MDRRTFLTLGLLASLFPGELPVWSNQQETSITFPPGATTGARIVIDNTGIKAYDGNNNLVLQLVPDTGLDPSLAEPGLIIGSSTGTQMALYTRSVDGGGILLWKMNDPNWKNGSLAAFLSNPGPAQISEVFLSPPAPSAAAGAQGNMQLQFLSESIDLVTNKASLVIQSNDTSRVGPVIRFDISEVSIPSGVDFKLGNGFNGGAYSGNYTFSQAAVASGALAGVTALATVIETSDYATPIAAGHFTPPVEGYYDFSMRMNPATGATREAVIITKNGTEIAHNESTNNTRISTQAVAEHLLPTDVIAFAPFYVSATTPQTLTGQVNISRRLT